MGRDLEYPEIVELLQEIKEECFSTKENRSQKHYISEDTWHTVEDRRNAVAQGNYQLPNELTKAIRKKTRHDREQWLIKNVEEAIDVRDQWMGLKTKKRPLTLRF